MKKSILVIIAVVLLFTSFSSISFAETKAFERFTGLYIKTDVAKPGEKIYVDLYMLGDKNDVTISANFYSYTANSSFNLELKDIMTNNPYFVLPEDAKVGNKYEMYYINVKDSTGAITYATNQISNATTPYTNCLGKKYITVKEDEQISLDNISIKNNTVQNGEKVYFDLDFSGDVQHISVTVRKEGSNTPITGYLGSIDTENPYLNLNNMSNKIEDGTYKLTDVCLFAQNNSYIQYSNYSTGSNLRKLDFDVKFTVESIDETESQDTNKNTNENTNENTIDNTIQIQETENITEDVLKSISLNNTEAKINDKIYVDINVTKKLSEVMLSFYNQSLNNMMVVYLKDLYNTPYFIVPFTTQEGSYELNYAVLTDENGNITHYRKGNKQGNIKHFNFNSILEIKSATEDSDYLYLDNESITPEIINKISDLNSNVVITVNANNDYIVKESLFESIKGSNKNLIINYGDNQWVFNGTDIVECKDVDVSIELSILEDNEDEAINSILNSGLILNYAQNGDLPGKTLVRIKATEDLKEYFNSDKLYVYYYDEENNMLDKVAIGIYITEDDYIEFYINHNSKFVITSTEADSKYVSENVEALKLNSEIEEKTSESLEINTEKSEENKESIIMINSTTIIILIIVAVVLSFILLLLPKKENKK